MKSLVYVAIAAVAAGAGFGIYRYGIAPQLAPQTTPQQMAAQPGGAPAAAGASGGEAESAIPPVPTTLPDFSLQDRDGQLRSIHSWPGKSMIVNFWATWCAPCRREIPLLKDIQHKHAGEGFQVVGVAVDFRDDVLKYAKDIGMDYPILIGEQDGLEAVTKFGMGSLGFPFTVFTDTQGRIVVTHLGELTKPQSEILLAVVGQVNRGELTPAAAQVVATKQLQALESPATAPAT
ncbi:MAG TPA: TlpA disulfide reductase family protein [Steroidobacteraceae bacterium]|jgi:thiol-disulfide isomerase/thioredoxin